MTEPKTRKQRRRRPKPVHATWEAMEVPEWAPLVNHVGPFLARWFMYMGMYRLEDGGRLHAYKHVRTRQYFHIHDDMRCFVFDGDERYLEVPRRHTLFQVFRDYGFYPSDREEFEAYDGSVRAAQHLAWLRDEDPEGEAPPDWRTAPEAA